ncbi:MAG: 4-phosphoerythronate dehydrogenase [Gammaproteobacteria bacterium]|nr:4-phosphoerythronate dehydrogenase [Gammaproteobacteria bacterium]NND39249.1 4-phosphoerythronate dehydrogenase [Pseudomonadales bacterium]
MIRVVADRAIPYIEQLCGSWCELSLLPAAKIHREALQHADALLVRSVNRVDHELLSASKIKFVGSATAGFDHIAMQDMQALGISVACAPACNANAVVDYVLAALFHLHEPAQLLQQKVAVFGYGNVGKRLVAILDRLGVHTLVYDPLLNLNATQLPATASVVHSKQALLGCDVLSLHVPLTRNGEHATYHLLGEAELTQLGANAMLINSSRGAVVDNAALQKKIANGWTGYAVLDVWEGEPVADPELVTQVSLATPHIAGYSLPAKMRASHTIVAAMLACLVDVHEQRATALQTLGTQLAKKVHTVVSTQGAVTVNALANSLQALFPIQSLSQAFKQQYAQAGKDRAKFFADYREAYVLRDEHDYSALLKSEAGASGAAVAQAMPNHTGLAK